MSEWNEWQPVRIAPPPTMNDNSHLHHETISWLKANQGKIIHVRVAERQDKDGCRSYDVRPDELSIFEGFEKWGTVIGVCECQILAD
jgi:hypothetical protein